MEGDLCASWENLRGADARHVLRRHALSMRVCPVRHGSVLLSERPEGLSRHRILSGPRAAFPWLRCRKQKLPILPGLCDHARGRHHVQNLLGILPRVQQAQRGMDTVESNQLQVRVELQADCLAGVWAHHAEEKWRFIEPGDVEAAMQTASAIGDDRLQRRSQGYVVPDAFTHGSSEQRTRWFMTGLRSGQVAS